MYDKDEVLIKAPKIRGYILEGHFRPGHFDGVLSVVNKFFNIVNPDYAYFGKEDAQQLHLITLMVQQLFMNVVIVPVETLRESDGLALSSRNIYLSTTQREEALKISSSLYEAAKLVSRGNLSAREIKKEMLKILNPLEIGYVEILNRDFEMISEVKIGESIILVEALAGETRLLDNIWL